MAVKVLKSVKTSLGSAIELVSPNYSLQNRKVLVIGVFHGDEPQGRYLIERYLEEFNNSEASSDIQKNSLLFIPCLNPDGMRAGIRTNSNGVDLNRNFPTLNWGKNEGENADCDVETSDYFGGKSPASEIETKFVIEVIEEYKPDIVLTLHAPYKVVNYDGPAAEIAAEIQNTLQPKRLPDLPEVGFGFFFQPTKGICGDYCDVILARRDRIALIMADVAGKGMLSSMVMISLRAILHLVTNTTKDAATILDWVNKGITGKINVDHYATLTYVSYSADTHELEYANAGHQPMLLWRSAEKKIERIHQNSDPIGVERTSAYSEIKLTVEPGDIIILYTDGLVEALNAEGVQYGVGGLSKVVAENEDAPAKDIAAAVKHDLKNFLGSATMHDDQSLLVMKIKN